MEDEYVEMQGLEKGWWWGEWGTHQHKLFLTYDCAKTSHDYVHSSLKGGNIGFKCHFHLLCSDFVSFETIIFSKIWGDVGDAVKSLLNNF